MQASQTQLQVLTSVAVIMGAAVVALICDLLKRSNEQLRELAVELKVRREEESKRFQMLARKVMTESATRAPKQQALAPAGKPRAQIQPPEENGTEGKKEAKAEPPARRKERPGRGEPRRALSPEALAAIQRGEQLAAAPPSKGPSNERIHLRHPDSEAAQVRVPVREGASHVTECNTESPATVEVPVEIIEPAAVLAPAVTGRNRDWNSLLSARRSTLPQPRNESHNTAVVESSNPATGVIAASALPAGFQDGYVLSRLVESRQPITGLVVSIGTSAPHNESSAPANVVNLIQSLIGPGDFATQSGKDEFLLIYPAERGASAQRKLAQIAEQLWDFQLRSLGALSIQFSWGGVEVRSESFAEAIASASERMQETRRNRKILTMEPRNDSGAVLRRAV